MTAIVLIIVIAAALALLLYLLLSSQQDSTPEQKPNKQPGAPKLKIQKVTRSDSASDVSEGYEPCTFHTRIAGATYHCKRRDIGGFIGFVRHEPDNPYDPNAIGIYRRSGKLLGYVPKDEVAELRAWSSEERLPCVGFIAEGDETPIWGRVKIIDSENQELVNLIGAKYVKWLIFRHGAEFIPEETGVKKRARSESEIKAIVDSLDTDIAELESKLNQTHKQ